MFPSHGALKHVIPKRYNRTMKQSVGQLLDQMPEPQPHDNRLRCDISQRFASCLIASHADLGDACDALVRALERGVCSTVDDAVCSAVIGLINAYCQRERISQGNHAAKPLDENSCRAIERLYRKLGSASQERHLLLIGLARQDSPESLDIFVELICSDPPSEAEHAALAMVPLFSRERHVAALLFPKLFDALEHACMAPLVLDLANFLVREGGQNEHPAAGRSAALAMLLGELTQRLDGLNESPELVGASRRNKMASESIALVISLCDALALIGDRSVVGKLFQTLELSHRRIRTEAAAALARLGEDEGLKVLCEMAEQPLVRNRALAYLEELGARPAHWSIVSPPTCKTCLRPMFTPPLPAGRRSTRISTSCRPKSLARARQRRYSECAMNFSTKISTTSNSSRSGTFSAKP